MNHDNFNNRTKSYYLWVPRPLQVDVHYLTEGFEGLFVPTTMDSKTGLMRLMATPGAEAEAEAVIAALIEEHPEIRRAERRDNQ